MSYTIDSLIHDHIDLAKTIANREWRTATHALKKDDMLSLAYLGLVDAANRWEPYCAKNSYDPEATEYFKVFASLRIRGTIRDHIRKEDWATRTLRSKAKKLKDAGQDEGLSLDDLADKTGMTVNEIHKVNTRLAARPVSLDAHVLNSSAAFEGNSNPNESYLEDPVDTESLAFSNNMISVFVSTIKSLPVEVRAVLVLHYYSKLDLRKVAEELGLPETKVSQMHSVGVVLVKDALTEAAQERG